MKELEDLLDDIEQTLNKLHKIKEIVNEKHIKKNDRGTPYVPFKHKIDAYEKIFNILYEKE